MVGGRRRRRRTELLLLHSLLLWLCLHDVEASSCPSVLHKLVGDTVEFPSCLPPEGVTDAYWKYKDVIVVILDGSISDSQFEDRASLNQTNFSLALRRLTLQDSGDYSFISDVNNVQRRTVTITLQVHAPPTPPTLTVNSTWSASSGSCEVLLVCLTSDADVAYNLTVANQSHNGSRLQFTIWPQEETTVTCTVYKAIYSKSTSETLKCDNNTAVETIAEDPFFWIVVAAGAGVFIIIIIIISLCLCKRRQTKRNDVDDLTVYADISDFVAEGKPTHLPSEYDLIRDHRPDPATPMPHTVYDEIQLSRVRIAPESPYQDI